LIGSGLGARIIPQNLMPDQWPGSVCRADGVAEARYFDTHTYYG